MASEPLWCTRGQEARSTPPWCGTAPFQRIVSGYHPVVAAPGNRMHYLWVLAGASQTLSASLDPDHAEMAG